MCPCPGFPALPLSLSLVPHLNIPFLASLLSPSGTLPCVPHARSSLAVSLQSQSALSTTPSCLGGRNQPPHLAGPPQASPSNQCIGTRLPSAVWSPSGQDKGPGVLLPIPRKPLVQSLESPITSLGPRTSCFVVGTSHLPCNVITF